MMSGARHRPDERVPCLGRRPSAGSRVVPRRLPEPESLFWCARNGLKVGELPVRMFERQGGVSSIRRLRAAYYMVKVSLAILFDRIRRPELVHVAHPAPLPTP